MEHLFKKFLSSAMLCSMATVVVADGNNHGVVNQYVNRPQSLNSARKVAGEVPGSALVHLWDREGYYGYFGAAFEYDRSFRPGAISRALFGDLLTTSSRTSNGCDTDCNNSCETSSILVQGTDVVGRSANAIRAEDLYLSSDFSSVLTFKPQISNFILDFQFYVGFDECWEGGYFRLYAPFVHTKWDLNMCETVIANPEDGSVVAGSFAPEPLVPTQLLSSAEQYFAGQQPQSPITGTEITRAPLCSALMIADADACSTATTDCGRRRHSAQTKNGFGDIRAELGWNFWQCEDYHLGLNIQGAAPTGNRSNGTYLFAPVVGNGKYWELGGGLTGHYVWCRSADEERHFGIYVDAMVTHLFNSTQQRTFDLKNKPLSRYMLAAQQATPVNTVLNPSGSVNLSGDVNTVAPAPVTSLTAAFSGAFTPVANLTRQKVRASIGAQGDVSLWFNYTGCGFSWDLGYNFYGRSCEKFSCSNSCPPRLETESNTWALKGDAHVYGFFPENGDVDIYGDAANEAVALSVSESQATLTCPVANDGLNTNVDRAQYAAASPAGIDATASTNRYNLVNAPGIAYDDAAVIRTSVQSTFLSVADIDYNQGSRYISNKIFTHIGYKWSRNACWEPFLGIGGEVEFGTSNGNKNCNDTCPTTPNTTTCSTSANTCQPCDSCVKIGTSKWGVWLKTGLAFN